MTHHSNRTLAAAAALCLACLGAAAAPLDDLRRQVDAGQFDQAWATAQANPQLIGDVHFDFLYGVAAINVGRIAEGLLALERHLAAVPANDRARLELARGYFLLGEYGRARSEFEFVLRYNQPANVRANVASFLQAMQVREAGDRRGSARAYVETGLGYDNNVNGGTFRDSFFTPFGTVDLIGSPSRQVADGVGHVAIGGHQQMRVSGRLAVFAGADLDHRGNFDEGAYDLTNGSVYVGFTQLTSAALWRLTLGTSELMVGGSRYRDTLGLNLEGNFTPAPDLSVQAFAQYGEQRYATSDESRDAQATTLGATVTRDFPGAPGAPSVAFRASWTLERNQRLRPDLSNELALARLMASVSPIDKLRISAGFTTYARRYDAADVVLQTTRQDTSLGIDLAASYALDAAWSLRGEAQWSTLRSNQDLYDSGRKAVSFKVRYQF
jgi:hypothetical protein